MKNILAFLLAFTFFQLVLLSSKPAFPKYDYILGQKLTEEDVEPPDNYDFQIFIDEAEAIKSVFKNCDNVSVDNITLSPEKKKLLEDRLKRELDGNTFTVFIGKSGEEIRRYAVITDERGCFHPITFITALNVDGKIDKVAVMVYRESRGQDVARSRFLFQYKGKSVANPIKLNKDIIHITGATTSVRGINRGVRKALAIVDTFYLHGNRDGSSATPYGQHGKSSESKDTLLFSQGFDAFGGIVEILVATVSERPASDAFKDVLNEIKRLEKILNGKKKNSEVYNVNRKAAKKPTKCSAELAGIIKESIGYSRISNGAFDVTEGYLAGVLQKKTKKVLDADHLNKLIQEVSYENISLAMKNNDNFVEFGNKQTNIDLSLFSNGYIVDKIIETLKNSGISNALVSFNGNIRAIGNPPDDTAWKVAVPNPFNGKESLGYVQLTNSAVASPGEYEAMILKGRRELANMAGVEMKKHLGNSLLNSVVVASTAFEADALSSVAALSKMNRTMVFTDKMDGIEWMNLYEASPGSLDKNESEGMKDYFIPSVETISVHRDKPSCAF